ncbi:mycofactocin system GMC family oxidoreductase MftG [Rhodococcus sp. BP-349]|nr:mycofactocin system GMC family oxidoreductase MftG [Rhodococcus sp. BP-363]MBY6542166.1 mycofactocin system GMC family oxidoreductase MftG [Rhodococcus sp. BP-369]MBY6561397.1 mycofactocin system GMC family oxidoreductase MftG [Rhodococcus sp. BP-370]MBY6575688.1 mycofactocin system GMC family oxidoreductase MftG [Rhodococcus sp. BP-364]MBY6584989.1 mycofactocin system GMC family oxidoreductase MftG [Rhodococcus sp. BP-358]MBY6589326.1 mycofactocin system GMC family oxidoreductase MftG [Rho
MMVDVIVVGGGSAGCVAAAAFAKAGASVLILEAGHAFALSAPTGSWPSELTDARRMPIGPGSRYIDPITAHTTRNHHFVTTRGRVLGGSGAVNGGYFVRAPLSDFDSWPQDRWDRATVARHYAGIENDLDFGARDHHGSDGPVPVTRAVTAPLPQAFLRAAVASGYEYVEDLNAPDARDGIGAVPSNVVHGRRISMAQAYLRPVADTVSVRGRSRVARLIVRDERVVGVTGRDDHGDFTAYADRVVLAAGAVRTPNLLMHSGIGDAAQLRQIGLPTVQHLPGVGLGVADHPEIVVTYQPVTGPSAPDAGTPLQAVLEIGPLEIRPYTSSFDRMIPGLPPMLPTVGVAHMTPEARGVVTVVSDDPFSAPAVDHDYAATEADREALRTGVRVAMDILSSPMLAAAVAEVFPPEMSRAEMSLGGSLHTMGSARMGADDDPLAVLDSVGRVRGMAGLSVVDASMFPSPVSRGPHATVVMAAHRACAAQIAEI